MKYLFRNIFKNGYEADVGSIVKIVDFKSNFYNKYIYSPGGTFNGYCYKDYNAFSKHPNEVCYISESGFSKDILEFDYVNENKEQLIHDGCISTANSIKDEVRQELRFSEYYYEYEDGTTRYIIDSKDFDNELIEQISKIVFEVVDWQTTSAYISETDWCGVIDDYYNKKLKEKELEIN